MDSERNPSLQGACRSTTPGRSVVALALAGLVQCLCATALAEPCKRCGWEPPRSTTIIRVRSMNELRGAVGRAKPGTTILLENGIYRLDGNQLAIPVSGLVLRGRSGDRSKVILRGSGMAERMVAISVSAPGVTIADLTITQVGFHGVQVRGEKGASDVVIHNVHVRDVGQQLIKGSTAPGSDPCRNGLVSCCLLEYSDHAPSDYTNGIDVLNGDGWTVRDNTIKRIRGPESKGYRAGPAILFWRHSRNTVVERNWILDCHRGIALGLGPESNDGSGQLDHEGGLIRRNAVCNLNPWADEGIEVNASPGAQVAHNTVLVEGKVPWSISIRFPTASARVWNNLSNRQVILRDGAKADLKANVGNAQRNWFIDARRGDLGLARPDLPAIDVGVVVADQEKSAGEVPSFSGSAPDAGAFEYRGPSNEPD